MRIFTTSTFFIIGMAMLLTNTGRQSIVVTAFQSTTNSRTILTKGTSRRSMGLLDDFFSTSTASSPSSILGMTPSSPKVQLPPDFKVPEPKPLTITSSTNIPSLIKASLALALRLGTGAFVLGWQIDSLFYKEEGEEETGKRTNYSLSLLNGNLHIRDSSSVLLNAPRPTNPLILYEYDASPYCKRVREMINILDLTVEYIDHVLVQDKARSPQN